MRCLQGFLVALLLGVLVSGGAVGQQTDPKANDALQKRLNSLKEKGAQIIPPEGRGPSARPDGRASHDQPQTQTTPQPPGASSQESQKNCHPDASQNADVTVTAKALWEDFSDNVIAAEKKYLGKRVVIQGQVAAIRGDNSRATIYLTGRDALIGAGVIACILNPSEIDKAAALSDGEQVEISGTCGSKGYQGWIEGVEFSDCVFRTPVGNTPAKTVGNSIKEPVPIEALIKEHRDNEIAARRKYDGKTFSFTGKVLKVDRAFTGDSYVFMGGLALMCDVYCYLDSKSEDDFGAVHNEQRITLRGVCHSASGALFDALKFSDCVMSE